MEYEITRSKRKTMVLHVHKDGSVEVRCPLKMTIETIEEFVLSKESWIINKVSLMKGNAEQREKFIIKLGSKLLYMGREYLLTGSEDNKVGFDGNNFFVPINMPMEDIKLNIIKLYKMIAKQVLRNKAMKYAEIMKINPSNVKINSAKTRWGSCSGNNINFTWKLIMADEKAIDYVVIHELAHTIEHNHSSKFWAIVEKYAPDYKVQQQQLKKLLARLLVEEWDEEQNI